MQIHFIKIRNYQYSKTLDLYDCSNWLKDENLDRHHVDAKFIKDDKEEYIYLY